MQLRNQILLFIILSGTIQSSCSTPVPPPSGGSGPEGAIAQFGQVDTNIYRGAQPQGGAFEELRDLGVQTVINFRHEEDEIQKEREIVESLGMRYISLPWRIQRQPDAATMTRFLSEVSQKENGSFFIHCRLGADRSAVADALYGYYTLGLSKEEAWDRAREGYEKRWIWKFFSKRRYNQFIKEIGDPESLSAQTAS